MASVRSSATATDFLHEALLRMPVSSVQVDGGSEFMQEFETACRDAGIPLHILPPRRPNINGNVERSNRTCAPSSGALEGSLLDHHNVRLHHALGLLTPAEFSDKLSLAA